VSLMTLTTSDAEIEDPESLTVEILELETYELPRAITAPPCGCASCAASGSCCRPSRGMFEDPRRRTHGTRWADLT